MLAAKSADTYQEPIKHTSYDKKDKKAMVYSITKNQQTDSAAIAPDRPWNVWDENTTDVNTLHNDPLMVELAIGNCEVTSPHRHQQLG
ncbi:hypothetical protein F2Q69_00013541 [Brassica cretica]|uniref:Uncharacterized protein n=1 Tax=Brassica cretica TaxID=69181 RepID=A0A8S9R4M6_BRACR|nr:hypothetical protein F2Q69_00013541 [Brassica cretica]